MHLSKLCKLIWLLLENYCHKFAKYFGQKFKWNKMLLFSKLVLSALLKWGRFPGGLCSITLIQFRAIFNFNIAKCHDEDVEHFGEWRWWWWLWWLQLKHMNESEDDGEDRLCFKTNMKSSKHERDSWGKSAIFVGAPLTSGASACEMEIYSAFIPTRSPFPNLWKPSNKTSFSLLSTSEREAVVRRKALSKRLSKYAS